jgi:hypothetical protein
MDFFPVLKTPYFDQGKTGKSDLEGRAIEASRYENGEAFREAL